MKTLELKLKKDVFIVDAINEKEAFDVIFEIFNTKNISDYKFLCKGSELTEEIASELVEEHYMNGIRSYEIYNDYRYNDSRWLDNAKESFISAVESKGFYWLENPIKHPKDYEVFPDSLSLYSEQEKLHLEAEEKTFRNPLIFVKK